MKNLGTLFVIGLLASTSQAQSLLVSDFSSYIPGYYSSAPEGPWSDSTAQSGASVFTIANFGDGTPSGLVENGFGNWLGETSQDWSSFNFVQLTGTALAGNETDTLFFSIEDNDGHKALTAFMLNDFIGGSTVSVTLNFGEGQSAVNRSDIAYWGFQTNSVAYGNAPDFAFSFDNLALTTTAIPEPSTVALSLGGIALFAGVWRRRRKNG